ncbi:MAG: glycerol-3-phosphate 1-O-acyltransferase PlsY [Hyphomicrobiaceae bacterium]|nr:glycerol-3-phosphate 1-O-acyltransferase PlsY [Hyphomicrobiaceae bacterium]
MGQLFTLHGLLALVVGYLLGSVPFGLLLTRAAGAGDLREIGSGNIGATNVLRTGRKDLAAATLLLDALKGTLAVMMVYDASLRLGGDVPNALNYSHIAGFGALLGHAFPVWLRFQGGKGVSTFMGVLIGMYWVAAAWFGVVWLGVAAATRYSSLAALSATAGVVLFYLITGWTGLPYILAMAVVIFLKHHENIRRLRAGRESKIGAQS